MNLGPTVSFAKAAFTALGATGLVITPYPAVAHDTVKVVEEVVVVVEAPLTIRQVGRTHSGATIELIELKRRVDYRDLDLSRHADVIELKQRVETISKDACKMLSEMFPVDSATEKQRCIKKAIKSADTQLQLAIDTASRSQPGGRN